MHLGTLGAVNQAAKRGAFASSMIPNLTALTTAQAATPLAIIARLAPAISLGPVRVLQQATGSPAVPQRVQNGPTAAKDYLKAHGQEWQDDLRKSLYPRL